MSTNKDLAGVFAQMAAILEIRGESGFKVNAHSRVARALKDLTTDVATIADDEKALTAIDGVGKGSAKKIQEYVETGAIAEHAELLESIPTGLLEVLEIPGLGPKTVRLMWETAGITDMASLQAGLDSGAVEALPRMGKKTVQNIRDAIAFLATGADRVRLGKALPLAEAIVDELRTTAGVIRMTYAGSLRRGKETIGDIDVLASSTDPDALRDAFVHMDGVTKVLASGATKSSLRMDPGIQVDLRIVDDEAFGAALMYFTGSKEHNVLLRERAIKQSMRLNEYGLFPVDESDDGSDEPPQKRGVKPVAAKDEASIYEALGLKMIAPELREARGELDREPPTLVEVSDIQAELHAHTNASDGNMTIDELIACARERGFHTLAITDHSKSSAQANGLSDERLRAHIQAIREANGRYKDITVLAGSEVDILSDGRLDYDDDLLAELDFVVASPHVALGQDSVTATKRLLKAIEHPLTHVIGHPTGRIINKRPGLEPDLNALIEAAVAHDTALEINANHLRLDLRDTHVRAVVDAGGLIAIDTDAHVAQGFDQLRYGVLTGRRGGLTAEQCVNAWDKKRLHAWIKSKR